MKFDSMTLLILAAVLWFVGKQQGWFGQPAAPAAPQQPPVNYTPPNYGGTIPQPTPVSTGGGGDLANTIVSTVGNLGAHIIDGIFSGTSGGSGSAPVTNSNGSSWNFGVSY